MVFALTHKNDIKQYLYDNEESFDKSFDLEVYDVQNIKTLTASASACIKSNFNSFIEPPSSEINN